MCLQQLIVNHNIPETHKQILKNPTLLQQLDTELAARLLGPAIRFNNENIIQLIVKFGANVVDPLQLALVEGSVEEVERLLKSGKKPNGPEWYVTSLINCIFWRKNIKTRKAMLSLLIEHGFDTGFQSSAKENLLHLFIRSFVKENDYDAAEIAEILLDSGVHIHDLDFSGSSIMDYACTSKNTQLVSALIEKKFDVNRKNGEGETPLFMAVLNDNHVILDLLAANCDDVNEKNRNSWTALHLACYHYEVESIKILLSKGADVNAVNRKGETPFSFLFSEERSVCLESARKIMVKELAKLIYQ